MVALNPVYRVGWQLADRLRVHHGLSRRAATQARGRAAALACTCPTRRWSRAATRTSCRAGWRSASRSRARSSGEPKLLIADEPTTALDVTVQAEILELLRELQREQGMAILLVTHDWGVIADICERVVVMYAGQVVERAEIAPIFRQPLHPYTQALLASNPTTPPRPRCCRRFPAVVPKPGAWPHGCHFHPRCDLRDRGVSRAADRARVSRRAARDALHPLRRAGRGQQLSDPPARWRIVAALGGVRGRRAAVSDARRGLSCRRSWSRVLSCRCMCHSRFD